MSNSDFERIMHLSYWIGASATSLSALLLEDYDKEMCAKALVSHMESNGCEITSMNKLKNKLKEKYNIK